MRLAMSAANNQLISRMVRPSGARAIGARWTAVRYPTTDTNSQPIRPARRPPQLEYVGERCLLLSWRKLQIFSTLRDAGAAGLSLTEILSAVWHRGPVWRHVPAVKPGTVVAHLRQLNALLAETNLRIGSNGRASSRRWYLEGRP
jgi:hypothetical protein